MPRGCHCSERLRFAASSRLGGAGRHRRRFASGAVDLYLSLSGCFDASSSRL
jgi:hypothetical protein